MGNSHNQQDPENLIESIIDSDHQFHDNFQTQEQKERDSEITSLLRQYVISYTNKVKLQKRYRITLLILCSSIIGLFSLAFLFMVIYSIIRPTKTDIPGVVSLISVCITFLASILGLAQIITRYCFPENDEEYITKIVEAIQSNDLQNKLANMKLNTSAETNNNTVKQKKKCCKKCNNSK